MEKRRAGLDVRLRRIILDEPPLAGSVPQSRIA
jgi:hypothetical protein